MSMVKIIMDKRVLPTYPAELREYVTQAQAGECVVVETDDRQYKRPIVKKNRLAFICRGKKYEVKKSQWQELLEMCERAEAGEEQTFPLKLPSVWGNYTVS